MKLSKSAIQVLKSFSTINPTIYLQKGTVINTCTNTKTAYAEYILSDDEAIENYIGIYDLNQFLSLVDLMGDPKIEYDEENSQLIIYNDRSKLYYNTTNPADLTFPLNRASFPEDVDVNFELTDDVLTELNRVSRTMKIDFIKIVSEGGLLYLQGFNTERDNKMERVLYSVKVGESVKNVNVLIRMSNLKLIDNNYYVSVYYNTDAKMGAVRFKNDEEKLNYIIVTEADSYIKE